MLFDDSYKTVEKQAEGFYNISGSKFIGYIVPVNNEAAIKPVIAYIKELQPGASHYCWASKIATEQAITRFNDDGEPAGSAGRPILNVIQSNQLNNVLIVVVRYFGGTLLGIPGLISAYKTTALNALTNAKVIQAVICDVYSFEFEYLQLNEVLRIAREYDFKVTDKVIDNTCTLVIAIPKQKVEVVLGRLKDSLNKSTYLFTR